MNIGNYAYKTMAKIMTWLLLLTFNSMYKNNVRPIEKGNSMREKIGVIPFLPFSLPEVSLGFHLFLLFLML